MKHFQEIVITKRNPLFKVMLMDFYLISLLNTIYKQYGSLMYFVYMYASLVLRIHVL